MQVLCTVMDVVPNYEQGSKIKARAKVLFDQPFDATEFNLFEHHEKYGLVAKLQAYKGKQILLPLQAELYQGKVQLALPYGMLPELYTPAQSVPFLESQVDKTTGEIKEPPKSVRPAQAVANGK